MTYECLLACNVQDANSSQQTGSRLLFSQSVGHLRQVADLDNGLGGSCDRAEAVSLGGRRVTRRNSLSCPLSLDLGSGHAVFASMAICACSS